MGQKSQKDYINRRFRMNNKIIAVIGALLFAAAVVVGNFAQFEAAAVIEIALASFALCAVVISAVRQAKEKNAFSWKTVVVIALAVIGGVLCCIGGLQQAIFKEISGLVLALLSVIFGLIFDSKKA